MFGSINASKTLAVYNFYRDFCNRIIQKLNFDLLSICWFELESKIKISMICFVRHGERADLIEN